MGRVAAIVAAAIAGIASLPALLGSDAPPPVPPDVGLTPAPIAAAPLSGGPGADVPPPAPAARPTKRPHHPRPAAHRLAHRRGAHAHHHRSEGHRRAGAEQSTQAPSPIYGPSTVYSQPALPGEFRIER